MLPDFATMGYLESHMGEHLRFDKQEDFGAFTL
jgi:hypothetical protein